MADTKSSPAFGLDLAGVRFAETWIDEEGRLYSRHLGTGVVVCVEMTGAIYVGQLEGDEYRQIACLAPGAPTEAQPSESGN